EIQTLYPSEYALAKRAAELIKRTFSIEVPESELGFLALHIHSAISYVPVAKAVQFTNLIGELVGMVEQRAERTFERNTIEYVRLV
ncbi:PRD domain-containing protein, partial [Frankia sp. Cpl3]|nr:PRD domain-containing protein [Frankia sp. Cpl3]